VHQKHGTSEYSFLIEELPSLEPFLNGKPTIEVFKEPIESYRQQRRKHLKLYPTAAETLLKIKGRGACIIGYTESMAFYSNYRMRRLGLDGVLDYLFCPEDHLLPGGLSPDDVRRYPAQHYELKYTKQKYTPKGSKKPDTEVLDAIIDDLKLSKAACVYVGDNLLLASMSVIIYLKTSPWHSIVELTMRGQSTEQAHKRPEYKLLQEVTHWTPEEVQKEQKIKERDHVNPTYS
jgi:hypothetical protein